MITSNIKIITDDGKYIDYISENDLNIKMNRIADDLTNIESRFGEYSLSFKLPKTRNNIEVFQFAGQKDIKNAFKVNPLGIKVYNNNLLILSGQLELRTVQDELYDCVFYSKYIQLIDQLKDKNMQDIKSCPKIVWNYESTIRSHINAGYKDSDETPYQFPFIFYNTVFCPTSVFNGLTDTIVDANGTTNHTFQRERDWQNWYYIINHSTIGENNAYHHQIPLAFYLKSIMEYMLLDIGWTMGGSFFEDKDVKKIIVPYVGDTDVYDRAAYCTNGVSITGTSCGAGTLMLDTGKFMPDYDCANFLADIMSTFNLYFNINLLNQTIQFETYDVMFGNKVAPISLDNKIEIDTLKINKNEDYDPSISWDSIDNKRILGDNRYIASSGTSAYSAKYLITSNDSLFDQVYNYVGTTSGKIKIGLGTPAIKRMRIRNEYNYSDVNKSAGDHVLFLPFISDQLPEDNGGKNFNKKDTDTTAYNNEATIKYKGKPTLYFYYGISVSDFQQKTPTIGGQKDYFYINFSSTNQKLGIASPFAYNTFRDNINQTLVNAGNNPITSADDPKTMLASYMQSIYLMMGTVANTLDDVGFSLIFANNVDFGETIYTKFHLNKYQRYQNSEIYEANMKCTPNDWANLTINQPIVFRKQLFSLIELSNYDIVKQTAQIKMIKML